MQSHHVGHRSTQRPNIKLFFASPMAQGKHMRNCEKGQPPRRCFHGNPTQAETVKQVHCTMMSLASKIRMLLAWMRGPCLRKAKIGGGWGQDE